MSDVLQGSSEWKALRTGRVTASRIADIVSKTKSGYSTSRANYMAELLCERLTGQPTESFTSPAMRWGTETEPLARKAYSFYRDADVVEVGFVTHPTIPDAGASPDGLVGDEGLLEIKCPLTATHLDTLLSESVPEKYMPQMMWQLACTGRKWVDYASFDSRLPEEMRLYVHRVERDEEFIGKMESEVRKFLAELDAKVAKILERYGARAA